MPILNFSYPVLLMGKQAQEGQGRPGPVPGMLNCFPMPLKWWGGKLLTATWDTAAGKHFLIIHGGLAAPLNSAYGTIAQDP